MDIDTQLFVGRRVVLGPIDHENDPPFLARWSHDADYLRLLEVRPVYPISEAQAKKRLEALEKELDEGKDQCYFTIRRRQPERLLGFATIRWIDWVHGHGWIHLGLGDRQDWRQGYGTEVLELLAAYAFSELNLYRLSAEMAEYNAGARRLFEKAGFREEVRRRRALSRDGQRWDVLLYGLLRQDWEERSR